MACSKRSKSRQASSLYTYPHLYFHRRSALRECIRLLESKPNLTFSTLPVHRLNKSYSDTALTLLVRD